MRSRAADGAAVRIGEKVFGVLDSLNLICKPAKVKSVPDPTSVCMIFCVDFVVIARIMRRISVENIVIHRSLSLDDRQDGVLN